MDHPRPTAVSEGVLRKLVIVALLALGAWGTDRLFAGNLGAMPPALLSLGFALLAAFTLGQLAVALRLPAITGYLVAGILLGDSLRATLPQAWVVPPLSWPVLGGSVFDLLAPLEQIALGFIALSAGALFRIDALRDQIRKVGGIIAGQAFAILLFIMLGAAVAELGLPYVSTLGLSNLGFSNLNFSTVLGFGAIVAALCLSGSPAATLAVLHGTGAKGPVARTVLASVVLKEVLSVLAFAVAAFWLAASKTAEHGIKAGSDVLLPLAGSIVLGVLAGAVLAIYVNRIRRGVPLFTVGLVVISAFLANHLNLSTMGVLLAAGIVAANVVSEGEQLMRDIVRMSTPLYLVVFAMFGAGIRLDVGLTILPFALALVLLRAAALRTGVAVGARIAGAESNLVRFSWTGFLPQAGVALPLVLLIQHSTGPSGEALAATVLIAVALNELLGPALFRHALVRAGEMPVAAVRGQVDPSLEQEPDPSPPSSHRTQREKVAPWPQNARGDNPWGKPPRLASLELNQWLSDLEADLQGLARDVVSGRLDAFRKDAHAYLRQLRMELLRHHRRVSNRLVTGEEAREGAAVLLRVERSELAERWSAAVLARGARINVDKWEPTQILDAIDQLAEDAPEFVEAPYEPTSLVHPEREPIVSSLLRMGLRLQHRWASFTGGSTPSRSVAIGTLARYHLMGKVPSQAEGVAALLIDAERQLIDRTRELFEGASHGYRALLERIPESGDDPELRAQLAALRRSFEEDIAAAIKEVNHIVEDGEYRMACVLGAAQQSINREAVIMSTLDLPTHRRRFSRVHGERERAKRRLTQGFVESRQVNAAQYSLLALEFEMGSMEGQIEDAVHSFATDLGRSVEGRAHHQIVRVAGALDEAIQRYEARFEEEMTGEDLSSAIREEAKPLERVVSEAVRASLLLRDQLADEHVVAPLLDGVARATRGLTDRYRIPSGRPARGDWRIPAPVPVVEVPFRRLVQDHVESEVSPNLVQVMRDLVASVQPLAASIEELDRRISFNVEVAVAEVDGFQTEAVPPETRTLVREMILGALQRSRARIVELQEASVSWGEEARQGVQGAVVGGLEQLRWQLVEGKVGELRSRLARETDRKLWLERVRRVPSLLIRGRRELRSIVRAVLGGERIEKARLYLGLPTAEEDALVDANHFVREPGVLDHLPLVYRRLFSAQALEAGDLLVGRTDAIQRARKALSGASRHLRAVALIGADGVGKGAVASAIVRGVEGVKPETWTFSGPVTVEQVDQFFATPRKNRLITVGGFHWLVSARPGGIEPLRRFVAGVIRDEGTNAWLVKADKLVWEFASSLAPVHDAFPEVVDLAPFDVNQLESAVLARHGMSGYELAFGQSSPTGIAGELNRRLFGGRTRQAWFRDLHEASGGLIRDALLLWMSSVQKVDEAASSVWMGPVPSPPVAALRLLPEDVLLTLWHVARNGWTDPQIHASLFRMTPRRAEAHLARLVHWGLLDSADGRYRIVVHLRGAVVRVMQERRWVT